jgi:hypothetical protein
MNELSITTYLAGIRSDIFRVLPMKEQQDAGKEVYLQKYIETLIINLLGGLSQFDVLGKEKQYIYVITNIRYLMNNEASFEQWRRTILATVNRISSLYKKYGGTDDE